MNVLVVLLLITAVVSAALAAGGFSGRFHPGWLSVGCIAGALLVPVVSGL